MFERFSAWWKNRRAEERESEEERLEEQGGQVESPRPGGWSPIGDLSKLSEE
jgi:hypothetical protein